MKYKKIKLKYEILEKKEITEISCNIRRTDIESQQLIYASQLYCTFFAVCAKLILTDDKKNLKALELHLINYKGPINLGLLEQTKKTWNVHPDGRASLILHLKANNGVHGHGANNKMRINCGNYPLNELQSLLVGRKLHKMNASGGIKSHLDVRNFDSEFYYRDGSIIVEKERIADLDILDNPIQPNNPNNIVNLQGQLSDDDYTILVSKTGSCETTFSNFV